MNVDNFFNNSIDVSKDDYVYGYVHMYYNYNDTSTKNSGVRSCYYSNYIKGTFTDTSLSKVRVPKQMITEIILEIITMKVIKM